MCTFPDPSTIFEVKQISYPTHNSDMDGTHLNSKLLERISSEGTAQLGNITNRSSTKGTSERTANTLEKVYGIKEKNTLDRFKVPVRHRKWAKSSGPGASCYSALSKKGKQCEITPIECQKAEETSFDIMQPSITMTCQQEISLYRAQHSFLNMDEQVGIAYTQNTLCTSASPTPLGNLY